MEENSELSTKQEPKVTIPIVPPRKTFTRDFGNFKQDGSPLLQEYDESWTQDKCPSKKDGHDLNKVIGARNGKKFVECVWCGAQYDSAETAS